ncbi:hypothetical protein PsorP6_014470 [Peronosclerospora sorghi]|uniref:Uncharacterized protein n=1 Tax=Peronosclerospora sorghi TaxID=230839 RepID=A0ACC0VTA4_9STRA|nr:hypothetical protein PsorP6_014470 [Peronosclerospora sorghi]
MQQNQFTQVVRSFNLVVLNILTVFGNFIGNHIGYVFKNTLKIPPNNDFDVSKFCLEDFPFFFNIFSFHFRLDKVPSIISRHQYCVLHRSHDFLRASGDYCQYATGKKDVDMPEDKSRWCFQGPDLHR